LVLGGGWEGSTLVGFSKNTSSVLEAKVLVQRENLLKTRSGPDGLVKREKGRGKRRLGKEG